MLLFRNGAPRLSARHASRALGLLLAVGLLALVLLPACGSEVQSGQTGGGGGHGAAAGGTADGGSAGSAGGGGCNAAFLPCSAYPDLDWQCEGFEGAPHHLACGGMRVIAADCVYLISNCTNCADWCCPPEPWNGPTYAELPSGAGGDAPAPAGCERQPDDDFACDAQDKPPYAVYCAGLDTDSKPAGCSGNPYGANSCAGPDEGYFCCPAP